MTVALRPVNSDAVGFARRWLFEMEHILIDVHTTTKRVRGVRVKIHQSRSCDELKAKALEALPALQKARDAT